jgi:hypothetical protein
MIHDRQHHLAQRRITYLLRRALGDLFLGPYSILAIRRPPLSVVGHTRSIDEVKQRYWYNK